MTTVLGIDMGGTYVKAGVVDAAGRVHATTRVPSAEREGVAAWLAAGLDAGREALAGCASQPVALGLSVPGAVDRATATLLDLVDRLDAGDGLSLSDAFGGLGLPVFADNDARAALAAECRWGVARACDNVVLLTLGTGLGGAVLIDGRPLGGTSPLAGNQLGHTTIELDGAVCVCRNRGCAETLASASGLLRLAREHGLGEVTPAWLLAHCGRDEPRVDAVVGRFLDGLAAAIVNAVHAYQPDLVVLGGGLMASADRILPGVRQRVAARAWTIPRGRVRIEASSLGDDGGLLAGAAVALSELLTVSQNVNAALNYRRGT